MLINIYVYSLFQIIGVDFVYFIQRNVLDRRNSVLEIEAYNESFANRVTVIEKCRYFVSIFNFIIIYKLLLLCCIIEFNLYSFINLFFFVSEILYFLILYKKLFIYAYLYRFILKIQNGLVLNKQQVWTLKISLVLKIQWKN